MRARKTFAALALIALCACQQTDTVDQAEAELDEAGDAQQALETGRDDRAREESQQETDAELGEKTSPATGPVPATPQREDARRPAP